jgi:hypothetical protein
MKKPTQEEIDAAMEGLFDNARRDIIPKMAGSAFCITVVTPDGIDPYLCLQLGACLLLEKPLLIIAIDGVWIPARVRALADAIVEGKSMKDPEMQERVHKAMRDIIEKFKEKRA